MLPGSWALSAWPPEKASRNNNEKRQEPDNTLHMLGVATGSDPRAPWTGFRAQFTAQPCRSLFRWIEGTRLLVLE